MSEQQSGERATLIGRAARYGRFVIPVKIGLVALGVAGASLILVSNHTRSTEKVEEQSTAQATYGKRKEWEPLKPTVTQAALVKPVSPEPTPTAKPVEGLTNQPKAVTGPAMSSFAVAPLPDVWKPKVTPAASDKADEGKTHMAYVGKPIPGGRAGPMGDTSLVLMPGLVRCSMDTAINSDLAGPFICHLPGPILSRSNVVLMEQGTFITGTYDNKTVQGQKRLPTIAAVGYTPNDCAVPFGTPMADSLGRTGLEGEVDNHIWARFGGAVLVSLIDSALSILQASVAKGGNTYLSFSGGGVGSLAQDILRATIDQKPTITVNQGSDVALWITAPINFNDCYKLETRR